MYTTQNNPAVVCRDLTKDFGTGEELVRVLRGVDLEAPYGERTLLVGPGGCGKTPLLCLVAGLVNKSGGTIEGLGTDVDSLGSSEKVMFRRRNLGFVFQ